MATSNKICPLCAAQTPVTIGMELCKFHRGNIHRHVAELCLNENKRAIKRGLIGDLTAEQVSISLRYFTVCVDQQLLWGCAYCGKPCTPSLDHWIPITANGASTFTNVIPCCSRCNNMKSNVSGDEFLDYMITVWNSATAEQAKARITRYWELVASGIDAVYRIAIVSERKEG